MAWTKATCDYPPGDEAARQAWIDAQSGVSEMLNAENDAEWLRIIADAKLGRLVRAGISPYGFTPAAQMIRDAVGWLERLGTQAPLIARLALTAIADALEKEAQL